MKFIDLKELNIHTVPTYKTYNKFLGNAEDLFDLSLTNFKAKLEKNFDIKDEIREAAVLFEVCVENSKLEDFEYLCDVIVDLIISLNTCEEKRDREARLAIPTNLQEAHCNDVPLRKAINNKCKFDVFSIKIYDSVKGWEYKIVNG